MSARFYNILYLLLIVVNVGLFITSIILQDLGYPITCCIGLMCVLFVLILLMSRLYSFKGLLVQASLIAFSLSYKLLYSDGILQVSKYMSYILFALAVCCYIYLMLHPCNDD